MSAISSAWARGECPTKSGIYYPDDSVREVVLEGMPGVLGPTRARAGERVPFDRATLELSEVTVLTEARPVAGDICVSAGEGSHGSDGFVAVARRSNEELLWLAFFDGSNPFVCAAVRDGWVEVVSNHGTRWLFPLDAPEAVRLEPPGA